MKKFRQWVHCITIAVAVSALPAAAASFDSRESVGAAPVAVNDGKAARRAAAVEKILAKWMPHVVEAYRVDGAGWQASMVSTFDAVSVEALERAAGARTFDAMNAALLPASSAKALGDIDRELVFVPITPCRIADTRLAGGQIATGATRSFDVTAVSNYSFQGGSATNCDGAGAAGSFAAGAFNITVVTPPAAGYITAFPFGATMPLAATVNYVAGDIRGNFAIVKLDQGASANELSIFAATATHVVIDMVGYFTATVVSFPRALECVSSGDTIGNIGAGGTINTVAPACPAGYTQTATNCESSTWQMPFVYFADGTCSAQNNSSSAATLRASRTCCRVP